MRTHRHAAALTAACVAACALAGGCGNDAEAWTLQGLLKKLSGSTPKQNVAMAFDPNDADRRREGILGLSEKGWGLREPYLKGYAAILRTDDDPLVRAAAVRALGKAKDPNYLEDVGRALFDKVDFVRQDAAAALDNLTGPAAVDPLCNRVLNDTNQDVRANCARALRHYRRQDALQTLIECLADKAFGVRYQAHQSLVALTGQDRGFDQEKWVGVTLPTAEAAPEEAGNWWDRLWRIGRKPSPEPPGQESPAEARPEKEKPGG